MVKKLLLSCVIIAIFCVGLFVVLNRPNQTINNQPAPTAIYAPPIDFHWGGQVRAFNLSKSTFNDVKSSIAEQIALAKELNLTDVRANVEDDDQINDEFINQSLSAGLTPVLVLEPKYEVNGFSRQNAYDYAYKYATRYKGKVKYYQLANEASGVTIKPTHGGDKADDYDETKYQWFKELLLGFSQGVRDADADAQRIISSNWVGVAVIDKLIADNVNFEIIGWNWYSSMGNDLIVNTSGSTLNIPEYLKKYNKKFWVVELNRTDGTLDGNEFAQYNFFRVFMSNTLSHNNINGIFVFLLTDQCADLKKGVGNMGIVKVQKNTDGTCQLSEKKKAFSGIQEIISKK